MDRRKLDIAGKKFGRLITIKPTEKRKRGCIVWFCRCDCGNTHEVMSSNLVSGGVRSCGCLVKDINSKNITSQVFGRLIAIKPTGEKKRDCIIWYCLCECGGHTEAHTTALMIGVKKSCGCLPNRSNIKDLTGRVFGRLKVKKIAYKKIRKGIQNKNRVFWLCQCECGNTTEVVSGSLVKGDTKSCGCLHKEAVSKDITGFVSGKLTAIKPIGKNNNGVMWLCQCECGNKKEIEARHIIAKAIISCGCARYKLPPEAYDLKESKRYSQYLTDGYLRKVILERMNNNASKFGIKIDRKKITDDMLGVERFRLLLKREIRKSQELIKNV